VSAMTQRPGILLVGGSGFLGRALAARFHALGEEVHVLSPQPGSGYPAGVSVHEGGQDEPEKVAALLARCARVFHLASGTTPGDTVWAPLGEARANVLPALAFLETLQAWEDTRLIFVSTGGALYGDVAQAHEGMLPSPLSYHGAGKVALEAFLGVLGQRRPGMLTILRPANLYGPGQSLRQGFGVVRTLLERARDGQPFTLLGGGESVRDYLFIDDMVSACLQALAGPAGTYNLGGGQGTSLKQLIAMVESATGQQLCLDQQPARASDAARIVLDIASARERLAWQPRVDLPTGLARTWAWLQRES